MDADDWKVGVQLYIMLDHTTHAILYGLSSIIHKVLVYIVACILLSILDGFIML